MKDEIKVFTSDDRSLKLLGELLSNDTSRRIIRCLVEKQMYTNELATKLDIPISLVIHHLRKLEELNLVDMEERQITRKIKKHKFFKMSGKFFVLPSKSTMKPIDKSEFQKIIKYIKTDYSELVCGKLTPKAHNKLLAQAIEELLKKLEEETTPEEHNKLLGRTCKGFAEQTGRRGRHQEPDLL